MNKDQKKNLRRRFAWFSLRVFTLIAGRIPLRWNYALGTLAGRIGYLFLKRHRKIAFQSVAIAFPHLDAGQHKKLVKECFAFIGQSPLELLYFAHHPRMIDNVRIEGKEFLDQAFRSQKGIIGITAHLGSFPLINWKLAQLGYPVSIVARPMRDRKAGKYIYDYGRRVGMKIILSYPRQECINEIIRTLRCNEMVTILMDQNFGTGGVWVKFFGRLAATPVGPIVLAIRTKSCMLPICVVREGVGKHCVKVFPPLDIERGKNIDDTILRNTVRITRIIEGWVNRAPEQWSWIHRRWKSRPPVRASSRKSRVEGD